MSNLEYQDQSSNHKYRTELPNIIFECGLTPNEFMLYSAIKRCAGDHGKCTKSILNLSKMCGLSQRTIQDVLKLLCKTNEFLKKPLINIIKRKTDHGDRDTNLITINDIWPENYKFMGGGAGFAGPGAGFAGGGAENNRGVVQDLPDGGAGFADKEEPFKKNIYEEEQLYARSATSSPPRQKDLLSFDPSTKKFTNIQEQDMKDWQAMYPHVQLGKEILKAANWLVSNPSKSNKKNWRKYLTGWLNKANDWAENKKAFQSTTTTLDRRTKNADGTPMTSPADGRF